MSKLICFNNKLFIKCECVISFIVCDGKDLGLNCKKVLQINCISNVVHRVPFDDEEETLKIVTELRRQLNE